MPVPSFAANEIPEFWKAPLGPYRQGPNGRFYYVSPFNPTPWEHDVQEEELPDGFVELFGEKPDSNDYSRTDGGAAYRQARNVWEQALSTYEGRSIPAWVDMDALRDSVQTYLSWGMGEPVFYQVNSTREILEDEQDPDLTLRTLVRFPDSELPGKDFDSDNVAEFPHLVVAAYQIALLELGEELEEVHPFVPPHLVEAE